MYSLEQVADIIEKPSKVLYKMYREYGYGQLVDDVDGRYLQFGYDDVQELKRLFGPEAKRDKLLERPLVSDIIQCLQRSAPITPYALSLQLPTVDRGNINTLLTTMTSVFTELAEDDYGNLYWIDDDYQYVEEAPVNCHNLLRITYYSKYSKQIVHWYTDDTMYHPVDIDYMVLGEDRCLCMVDAEGRYVYENDILESVDAYTGETTQIVVRGKHIPHGLTEKSVIVGTVYDDYSIESTYTKGV